MDASNALAKKVAGAGTGVLRGAGANGDVHGVSGGMNGSAKKQKMAHHYSVIGATGEVCTNGKRAGQDQTHHNIDKCSNGSARKADDSTSVIMDTSNGENCPNIDNDDGNGNKNGNDNGAGADAGIVADVYRRNTQEKYRLPEMQEMQRRKIEEE